MATKKSSKKAPTKRENRPVGVRVTTSRSWTILLADELTAGGGTELKFDSVEIGGVKGKALTIKIPDDVTSLQEHYIVPYVESEGTAPNNKYFTLFTLVKPVDSRVPPRPKKK